MKKWKKPSDNATKQESAGTSDYKVGYRKPPVGSRFAKGVSGNPNGRPKGSRGLRAVLQAALNQKVTAHVGTKERKMRKVEVLVQQIVNGATKGDFNTGFKTLALMDRLESEAAKQIDRQKAASSTLSDEEVLLLVFERKLGVQAIMEAMKTEELQASMEELEEQLEKSDVGFRSGSAPTSR